MRIFVGFFGGGWWVACTCHFERSASGVELFPRDPEWLVASFDPSLRSDFDRLRMTGGKSAQAKSTAGTVIVLAETGPSPVASIALLPALATNNSLGCLLNASRPTEWMLLEGAGGYRIRPYGVDIFGALDKFGKVLRKYYIPRYWQFCNLRVKLNKSEILQGRTSKCDDCGYLVYAW